MKTIVIQIIATILLLSTLACNHDPNCHSRIRGNGNIIERTYTTGYFNKVKFSETVTVHFAVGATPEVRIKAESNVIDHIQVETNAGLLKVKSKDGFCINAKAIEVYITAPSIQEIENDGTTYMDGEIFSDQLSMVVNGTLDMNLAGLVQKLSLVINGTCNFDFYDMNVNKAYIKCNGTTRGKINVSEQLTVDVNGTATIKYRGYPQISQTINGSGKIINDN